MINLSQFTTVFPHVTVTGSDAQDGLIISGRSGGLNYFRVSLSPAALTGNRNITIPNVDGAVVTTGDVGTVSDAMIGSVESSLEE